jgi:hypothetical protein
MEQSLRTAKRDVPRWLTVVAAEGSSRLASETFTMSCFWQGEARLGGLDGVVQTEAGWEQGREVVQVRYDPRRITRDQLAREAATMHCARMPVSKGGAAPRAAKDSDRKYHLRRSLWQYLPLTPMQRTKVNATLGAGGDPAQWLSPRQVLLAQRLKALWASDRARLERLTPPASLESLAAYADQIEALTSSVDD